MLELVGERHVAHETNVGVQHDVEAAIEVFTQWMRDVRVDSARLYVARQTDLERHPAVVAIVGERRILDESGRVPQAMCTAGVQCLSHGVGPIAFACVAGAREIVPVCNGESGSVFLRRKTRLTSREIESDNATVTI